VSIRKYKTSSMKGTRSSLQQKRRQRDINVRHVSYSHWLLRALQQWVIFMELPSAATTAVIVWNIINNYVMPQH